MNSNSEIDSEIIPQSSLSELQSENAILRSQLFHYQSMIPSLSEKYRRAFVNFERMRTEEIERHTKSDDSILQSEFQRSCSLLKRAQQRILSWKAKYSALSNEMNSLHSLLELLENEKEDLETRNQKLLEQLDRLTEKKNSEIDEFQMQELKFQLTEAEEQIEILSTKLRETPKLDELEKLRSEVTEMRKSKSALSVRLSESEKEVKRLKEELELIQSKMELK
jgi:chromosome segregation ATPase